MVSSSSSDRLIIFVKNPVLGKVKTRLAKSIGDEMALEVYKYLLELTKAATETLASDKALYYSDFIAEDDNWPENNYTKKLQKGEALGRRMRNAFKDSFEEGFQKTVIIGSDCPQLTDEIINMAFDLLDNVDYVIGPAKDGGYYLLGMKNLYEPIFEDKEWGTDSVFDDTVLDILAAGKKYAKLPLLTDVDDAYDLHLVKERFK